VTARRSRIGRLLFGPEPSQASRSVAILLIFAGGTLARYVVEVVYARASSATAYGIYTFALSFAQILAPLAAVGLPVALLRFLPSYLVKGELAQARGILRRARQLTVTWSAILIVIVFIVARATGMGGMDAAPLLSGLLIAAVAFHNLYSQLGRSLGLAPITDFVGMLLQPIVAGAALLVLQTLDRTSQLDSLSLLLSATLVSYTASVFLMHVTSSQQLRAVRVHHMINYETREWLRVAVAFMAIGIVAVAMTRIDVLIVGLLLGEQATGFYGAAAKTARVTSLSVLAINALIASRISVLFAQRKMDELQRTVAHAARWMAGPAAAIFLCFVVAGRHILTLFGPAFAGSYGVLMVLSAGQLLNAALGPGAYVLNLCGYERVTVRITVVGLSTNVLLSLALTWMLGPIGAAIGAASSIVGINWAYYYWASRLVGIRTACWSRAQS
jgi:O-antigen/teichoic acid export membrane protein